MRTGDDTVEEVPAGGRHVTYRIQARDGTLLDNFSVSLGRLGILGLGSQESLEQTEYQGRYSEISQQHRIYRREW